MYSLGVDAGGTFTDTILVEGDMETTVAVKTPTTADLVSGIADGIERACRQAGIDISEIDTVSHGHTIAVNTIIEESGARTALVTTEGFRDVLELAEGFRGASLLYNPCGEHDRPLIPRRHRFEVTERLDHTGAVVTPLDREDVSDVLDRIEENDIESVAICFLHSYRDGHHERVVADAIEERLPDVDVSRSSEVSPEIREYPRTATTAVDAYVKPRVTRYLSELTHELEAMGLTSVLNVMKSDGGVARPNVATERPITQTISGPVAGITAARFVGDAIGLDDMITFDMGGTSCDAGIIVDGVPEETPHREVGGMKINGPFTDLNTVGAGGGSIAWVNDVGALRVGPISAGAAPGPACYGRGGSDPTVTDADLVLGILNPDNFADGQFDLDPSAAREALESIADPLGMGVSDVALAIREVVDNKMATAVRTVSVEQAHDPRDFTLVGFGGAGPMHACRVARDLDIETVVVPSHAGLTSAMGLLFADIKHDYTRSLLENSATVDRAAVDDVIDEMILKGKSDLESEDVPPDDRSFAVSFDVRYEGQSHNLNVPLDGVHLRNDRLEGLLDAFEEEHEETYGFVDDSAGIELVNVRVTATGDLATPELREETTGGSVADARRGTREVIVDRQSRADVPYYDWTAIGTGKRIDGPAIVEMDNSTIWIPPEFDARTDRYRNVIATWRAER